MDVTRRSILFGFKIRTFVTLAGCLSFGDSEVKPGFVKIRNRSSRSHRLRFGPRKLSTVYYGRTIEVSSDSEFSVRLLDESGRYTIHAWVDGEKIGSVTVRVERKHGDGLLKGPGLELVIEGGGSTVFTRA
ncbi:MULTISPECIES: hypothetical protein [Halorussus]|uniref:hypothetical protein n=1 Tax=Halorussus TaxID=1070314 RepID=UPI00209D6DDF|nr:hypothetical protein [Halorussus vallis]USZ74006.1 hypothetical protein NGM07_11115 [Halorussus vallis]